MMGERILRYRFAPVYLPLIQAQPALALGATGVFSCVIWRV